MKYTIKPLEWGEENNCVFASLDPLDGFYRITAGRKTLHWDCVCSGIAHTKTPASSLSEAKATCQKHWEEQLKQYLIEVR